MIHADERILNRGFAADLAAALTASGACEIIGSHLLDDPGVHGIERIALGRRFFADCFSHTLPELEATLALLGDAETRSQFEQWRRDHQTTDWAFVKSTGENTCGGD